MCVKYYYFYKSKTLDTSQVNKYDYTVKHRNQKNKSYI